MTHELLIKEHKAALKGKLLCPQLYLEVHVVLLRLAIIFQFVSRRRVLDVLKQFLNFSLIIRTLVLFLFVASVGVIQVETGFIIGFGLILPLEIVLALWLIPGNFGKA